MLDHDSRPDGRDCDGDTIAVTTLEGLGWDAAREESFLPHLDAGRLPGRVTRTDRGLCSVLTAAGAVRARIPRDLDPTVGDWVAVQMPDASEEPAVADVLERRGVFLRHAAGSRTEAQVVAANVDVALILVALDARISPRRLERYMAMAWDGGARPVLVLTKADLCDDVAEPVAQVEAVAFGTPVHLVSATTGSGVEALRAYAAGGKTVALLGLSGAGKSTLANALAGHEAMKIGDVRGDGKGRHTTTHRELVPLPRGGVLIDTPGMRGLALWDAREGVEQTFGDVEELAAVCRFADCRHESEPGCAVLDAVERGTLAADRLESYQKLGRELFALEVRNDKRLASEQRKRWRSMERSRRAADRKGPR